MASSAIPADNPELAAAKAAGLRVWHRSEALAALMTGQTGVSVAGTHGKSTPSAMIAVMLRAAGADPSYVIGAPLVSTGVSAHLGGGEVFIVEADESDGSFLQYPTKVAVITNVEPDHLDNWGDAKSYFAGFVEFATADEVEAVVINADDPGSRRLRELLMAAGTRTISYGKAPDADVRITGIGYQQTRSYAVLTTPEGEHRLDLRIPGEHNIVNATGAFTVGCLLGLDAGALLGGAADFTGTRRRFQLVDDVDIGGGAVRIFDDYAHHPTELRAALQAAQRVKGEGRLIGCFQPHLYSRTKNFAEQFGESLAIADHVVVTDVYAAREEPVPGVSGELVADAARAHAAEVDWIPNKQELPGHLAGLVRPGDLVITLGAGDITSVGPRLAEVLRERTTS